MVFSAAAAAASMVVMGFKRGVTKSTIVLLMMMTAETREKQRRPRYVAWTRTIWLYRIGGFRDLHRSHRKNFELFLPILWARLTAWQWVVFCSPSVNHAWTVSFSPSAPAFFEWY